MRNSWLSLIMSLMRLFVLSFFPRDVLDEIRDLIEPVSEGFPTYSFVEILKVLTQECSADDLGLPCVFLLIGDFGAKVIKYS